MILLSNLLPFLHLADIPLQATMTNKKPVYFTISEYNSIEIGSFKVLMLEELEKVRQYTGNMSIENSI